MSIPLILSATISLVLSVVILLSEVAQWQRKEYRWDRYRDALLNTKRTYWALGYLLTVGLLSLTTWDIPYVGIISALIIIAYQLHFLLTYGVDRPKVTLKAKLILLTSIVLIGLLLILNVFTEATLAKWIALILSVPLLTALAVWIVNTTTNLRKGAIIAQAKSKRAGLKNLTVIGITGSYGKTSTKHFLNQLMPAAVFSDRHRNSELTIAQNILEVISADTTTFVTEMGAYTKGEIAALADLTKPTIGVITAIGNQHLSLFGSQENILEAKWELIEALPTDGIAVLNADDPLLKEKSASYNGHIIWYSATKPADVYATNIAIAPTSITCQLSIAEHFHPVTIPLAGRGALYNVLAATATAHAAGIATNQIVAGLARLKPYPHTMEVNLGRQGATIIDDSYSANEPGVINAIEHLAKFESSDKRIIMVPLIELGTQGHKVHQRIGAALAKAQVKVFIYHTDFQDDIIRGGKKIRSDFQPRFFKDTNSLTAAATTKLADTSVVLLEGRLPSVINRSLQ